MEQTELENRRARAANETLVISKTEGGYRVYNPANITHIFMVSGSPEAPRCNCPDFETHQTDPEWRCKHILALQNQAEKQQSATAAQAAKPTEPPKTEPVKSETNLLDRKKVKASRNGQHSQMLIKRSISPDGHIDSVSVEFSAAVDENVDEMIVQRANKMLLLQSEIVNSFLQTNGNGKLKTQAHENANVSAQATQNGRGNSNADGGKPSQEGVNGANGSPDNAVPAQLLNIAGMETRTGWVTFINVQVNGTRAKLFGDQQELAKHITAAGFASIAGHIAQGMLLNLPCRVITKRSQDGKYLNIERVLPAKPLEGNGRAGR